MLRLALAAGFAAACSMSAAQTGLSVGHGAGLGLKLKPALESAERADPQWEALAAQWRRADETTDYALYSGERLAPLSGMQGRESYAGILYALRSGWGTSLEAGVVQEAPLGPRRYALAGQLHASFESGQSLSLGLKYLAPESDLRGLRAAMPGEGDIVGGYGVTPLHRAAPGWNAAGYQLHMSYQYSPGGSVGIALGRDLENRAALLDNATSGLRQFSLTGSHWLSPSWAVNYGLLSDDMASPWKVQGLRLGVRYRW